MWQPAPTTTATYAKVFAMQIAKKSAVAIDYMLTIDGGFIVDASEKGDPLRCLHGYNNIIPGLEKALDGLKVGDKKTVLVSPEEGYGVYAADRVHQVPKNRHRKGTYNVGDHVTATGPEGADTEARITAMDGKNFTLDFNHELAGSPLTWATNTAIRTRPAYSGRCRQRPALTASPSARAPARRC